MTPFPPDITPDMISIDIANELCRDATFLALVLDFLT